MKKAINKRGGGMKMKRRQFCFSLGGLAVCHSLGIPLTAKDKNTEGPGYLNLHLNGELKKRGQSLWERMEKCDLCPRDCGAKRLEGQAGFCGASSDLQVSSYNPHFGEERPLVGTRGSGTVFFTHCGLRCVFCINWDISHHGAGRRVSLDDLAAMMLDLQRIGCHNINVVTPTHYLPHIILALDAAASKGLRLPLVYNTCGWEKMDVLQKLDGVADIYLPDFKYAHSDMASKYSPEAVTYPEITQSALLEMHRQVGTASPEGRKPMKKGLMIRHLVMPSYVQNSKDVMTWIAENLPADTYVNIMSQYQPVFLASRYPSINRRVTRQEYNEVVRHARNLGLTQLDIQGR